MKKLDRLKSEARQAATQQGHELKRFRFIRESYASAHYKHCNMAVVVCDNPAPNDIDTAGQAVALNCKEKA